MSEYISVGKIAAPFGVKGEVKVIPLTDYPERFTKSGVYFLFKQKMFREVKIQGVRIRGKDVIMKLEGIDTPEDAQEYRNALLQVPRGEVLPLPDDHYYHFQIVGLLAATEDGIALGKVAEVLETGSNDVYLVKDDRGREVLIPALKEVVKEIDLDKGLMVVRPLPGLLEG